MDYAKELKGKRIIIFGASRGIGFNIASNLVSKGSDVVISSGNEENLDAALLSLKKAFPAAQGISKLLADLNSHESLEEALCPLSEPLDAIIISSGVLGPSGDFAATDFVDWVDTFNVNLFGPAKLVHYFLKNNLLRKNSKVIFLSGGISGADPYFIAYSATKHALNGFAYSLAHQLSEKGIWVNSVLPGSYNTGMNKTRIERGPDNVGQTNFDISLSRTREDDTPKYQKLHTLIEWLCSSASDGIYGRLISAQHDDWQNTIARLKNTQDDVYKMIRKKE